MPTNQLAASRAMRSNQRAKQLSHGKNTVKPNRGGRMALTPVIFFGVSKGNVQFF
jgi:hypothetical protein